MVVKGRRPKPAKTAVKWRSRLNKSDLLVVGVAVLTFFQVSLHNSRGVKLNSNTCRPAGLGRARFLSTNSFISTSSGIEKGSTELCETTSRLKACSRSSSSPLRMLFSINDLNNKKNTFIVCAVTLRRVKTTTRLFSLWMPINDLIVWWFYIWLSDSWFRRQSTVLLALSKKSEISCKFRQSKYIIGMEKILIFDYWCNPAHKHIHIKAPVF